MQKSKIKKNILKGSAMLASLTFIVSGCMVDSRSWIPTIICTVCMAYLALFAYANRNHEYEEGDF